MRWNLWLGVLCIWALSAPAAIAEKTEPKHCERLLSLLDVAVQKRIQGDFSNKVQIALAAHERLGCDPKRLLEVLRITPSVEKARVRN